MAVENVTDITNDINADGRAQLDLGGFDYVVVQLVTPTATASFTQTSDSGAITGVSDGDATSATNWTTVQGVNLADGSAVSSLAASGSVKFNNMGRFLRIMGPGLTVTKALVRKYKIN